ncbi:ribonuclease H-like domain-containing protein [Candidatus Woesearchaeota archaeon]|nr:ribonuclease H-like domain-containing protein [Candidatus Woesearchaeota archaeon]
MIQNSFIFLEKIQHGSEKKLWNQGIHDWDSFINKKDVAGLNSSRKRYYDRKIIEARKHLFKGNSAYFKKVLPSSEMYRIYDFFKEDAVFLDIETTGLSPRYNKITVVGLYDGFDTKMMIDGINLDPKELKKELQKYKLIVTFNGNTFDIPFIKKQFPNLIPDIPSLDLRVAARRIGLVGGLKSIEKEIGIKRRDIVGDLSGGDALTLWKMYKSTGDDHYLNLLIEYNEEDIINLKTLAEHCMEELKKQFPQRLTI